MIEQRFAIRDGARASEITLDDAGIRVCVAGGADVTIPWSRLGHLYVENAYLNRFEVMLLGYDDEGGQKKVVRIFAEAGDPNLAQTIDALVRQSPDIDRRGSTRRAAYQAAGLRDGRWVRWAVGSIALLSIAAAASGSSLSRLAHGGVVVAEPDAIPLDASYVTLQNARMTNDASFVEEERRAGSSHVLASYAGVVRRDQGCGAAHVVVRKGGGGDPVEVPPVLGRYDGWWTRPPDLAREQQLRRDLAHLSSVSRPSWIHEPAPVEREPDCTRFEPRVPVFDPDLTPARDVRVVASWFGGAIAIILGVLVFKRSRERRLERAAPRSGIYR